jgi:membrane protease YdiL (CAAX protease family)
MPGFLIDRRRALFALFLVAPVPSLGVIAAMIVAPGAVGHAIFLAAKVWLIVVPAACYLIIEKGTPSWSPPVSGGLGVGALSGLAIAVCIIAGAWLIGVHRMDTTPLLEQVREMGLASPLPFMGGALAWTLINSLMEEYVYRWFILRQCETLVAGMPAVLLSAGIFTVHHVIAVSRYLDPALTVLASAGVFAGGVLWAWLYHRYRSIWPGWISHVLADVAVFAVGWRLLFG